MIKKMRISNTRVLATLVAGAIALAGCGSSSTKTSSTQTSSGSNPTAPLTTTSSAPAQPPAVDELTAAERPNASQFPAAKGRSLTELGALVNSTAMFGAATGTFTPGQRRLAFALNASSGAFIYAPTAVYIAANPHAPAKGPFLAPSDPMSVMPQYRSKENAGPGGIQAIYATRLPIPHKGTYTVLTLTRTAKGLIGAPGEIAVAASSPIPDVGQKPPPVSTDTATSVHGKTSLLTTRIPAESMQSVPFSQVLGKRPVALLFSTPQFCVSRVCGPVTDIAVQLQHQFGNRITFIHQEVYVGNQPKLGLRPQLEAFHLRTEPWLFIVNRRGVITSRLEGAFGRNEVATAIQAALR
jgi:hypothetical protein